MVFDCARAASTLDQAMNIVRRDGQVVLVALAWEKTAVLPVDWIAREIKLQASFGSLPEDWRIALDLMRSGKVRIGPMLSEDSFVLQEDIQQAFESLIKPTAQLQMLVKL